MFKKNQKNRAFFAAISMLLLSAIVITTASFAWFSLGQSAQASNLDLKVTRQGAGIEISANTTTFTDELTFEDLNGTSTSGFQAPSTNYNLFPATIDPASSSFSISSGLPAFFTGGVDKGKDTFTSFATTSADGREIYGKSGVATPTGGKQAGYYVFDVFVNYTGENNAALKIGSSNISVKNDESDGTTAIAEAANAMRIGFVNCGIVAEGSTSQATSGSEAVIFATNEEARNTNPIASTGKSDALDAGAAIVPSSAAGEINVQSGYACAVDTGVEDQVISIVPGINRIRVYIWMEGQDANCTDELQSQLISANLVFELV